MKKIIAILMIGAMASSASAVMLSEGTRELGLGGIWNIDSAPAETEIGLQIAYGQFVQDNVEVGLFGGFTSSDLQDTWNLGIFSEYNWDMGTELVPYVGIGLGYNDMDVESALVVGGSLGIKYFIAEHLAIGAEFLYEWASENIYVDDVTLEDTNISIPITLRVFF